MFLLFRFLVLFSGFKVEKKVEQNQISLSLSGNTVVAPTKLNLSTIVTEIRSDALDCSVFQNYFKSTIYCGTLVIHDLKYVKSNMLNLWGLFFRNLIHSPLFVIADEKNINFQYTFLTTIARIRILLN